MLIQINDYTCKGHLSVVLCLMLFVPHQKGASYSSSVNKSENLLFMFRQDSGSSVSLLRSFERPSFCCFVNFLAFFSLVWKKSAGTSDNTALRISLKSLQATVHPDNRKSGDRSCFNSLKAWCTKVPL